MSAHKKPANKAIHFADGVTVIALERHGDVLPCFIDTVDHALVKGYRWRARKDWYAFYAQTHVRRSDGKRTTLQMHSLLLPGVKLVDHEDGNGLNNQRLNLRCATGTQNNANSRKQKNGVTSQYRGVSRHKDAGKFVATIGVNNKHLYLGLFTNEDEAALAYNVAALEHFGAFARLNDVKATQLLKAA